MLLLGRGRLPPRTALGHPAGKLTRVHLCARGQYLDRDAGTAREATLANELKQEEERRRSLRR